MVVVVCSNTTSQSTIMHSLNIIIRFSQHYGGVFRVYLIQLLRFEMTTVSFDENC